MLHLKTNSEKDQVLSQDLKRHNSLNRWKVLFIKINVVQSSSLLYIFGVAKKIVSIQRWFLKDKDINKQSIYKVAWNFLAVSKTRGRLGVGFIMTKKRRSNAI